MTRRKVRPDSTTGPNPVKSLFPLAILITLPAWLSSRFALSVAVSLWRASDRGPIRPNAARRNAPAWRLGGIKGSSCQGEFRWTATSTRA